MNAEMPQQHRSLLLGSLMGATVIAWLGLFMSLFCLIPTGTFHADSYYLPIREFVPEENRHAMEEQVIEVFNSRSQGFGVIGGVVFLAQIGLLRVVRRQVVAQWTSRGE
jgi:hypothetical protein